MKLTVFAKKRQTAQGKYFYTYLAKLTKKDGTQDTVTVKFRDECGSPKPENCPVCLEVSKQAANLSIQNLTDDEGNVYQSKTLWVSDWMEGEPYIDHSLDDYE